MPSSADIGLKLPEDYPTPGRITGLGRFAHNLEYNGTEGIALGLAEVRPRSTNAVSPATLPEASVPVSWTEFKSNPVKTNASMSPYVRTASAWLNQCLEHHESCRKTPRFSRIFGGGSTHVVISLDNESAMPTRLLKLREETVQLVNVGADGIGFVNYVTLSHRWGENESCKTVSANFSAHTEHGISISELPRTYRDAVEFTKGLGYSYLWIDSLCIIQDDEDDWRAEAPRMACVYGNSICTIAAQDAKDNDGGMFVKSVDLNGLDERAWVLQERMISPRSILFSNNTISWECRQGDATFDESDIKARAPQKVDSSEFVPSHPKDLFVFFRDFELSNVEVVYRSDKSLVILEEIEDKITDSEQDSFLRAWWKFVSFYSTCKITNPSQKFLAICGITNTVLRSLHLRNHFGLWGANNFLYELTWYVDPNGPDGDRRTKGSILAPSWAWPSVNEGRIVNDAIFGAPPALQMKPFAQLPYSTSFEHELPYKPWQSLGAVSIALKGHLREAIITKRYDLSTSKVRYDVEIEPAGRYSDSEQHFFRPDDPNDFPLEKPVTLTTVLFYHYGMAHTHMPYAKDIFLVLQKATVLSDQQGNVDPSVDFVGFIRDATHLDSGTYEYMTFGTDNFDPDGVEDEKISNERTFVRYGYMETRYVETRDRDEVTEERWWRYIRII